MKLQGKSAIITGAGRGIGEAVALAFAREGARLTLAARSAGEIQGVAGRIRALGGVAEAVPTDVSRLDQVERLIETAAQAGPIDVLINCAGAYGPVGPFSQTDLKAWVQAIEINLLGTVYCCRAVLPHMIPRRQGKIINFSGGGATAPLPRFSAYATSKAAVVRLTETLAEELRGHNIQANAIAPGMVDTRLQDAALAAGDQAGELAARLRQLRASGRGGTSPEVAAQLAVFLASDASGGLTGKLIAAPHDGWQSWDARRIAELMEQPWLTLRRLDAHTLRPLLSTSF